MLKLVRGINHNGRQMVELLIFLMITRSLSNNETYSQFDDNGSLRLQKLSERYQTFRLKLYILFVLLNISGFQVNFALF